MDVLSSDSMLNAGTVCGTKAHHIQQSQVLCNDDVI